MPSGGRRILLGVTGSIAAYKAPLLVREFVRAGADVRVALTKSACAFVTPLTLATVSRNPVVEEPLPTDAARGDAGTWHIHLAQWADAVVIAPASANTIAKIAHGRADSAVSMLALAAPCPVVVAPAMDEDMLLNAATQDNLDILRARGIHVIDPAAGELASGLSGEGRLPEVDVIVRFVTSLLANRDALLGVRMLVTAGPTHEPIDPVRFIGNSSSGKMGYAIAAEAARRSAQVTLISGPTTLRTPRGVSCTRVVTAREMRDAVMAALPTTDVLVMAAAVADFAPTVVAPSKIKKNSAAMSIALSPTPDILQEAAASKGKRLHVGFALETESELAHAKAKLKGKNLDLIVLNSATTPGAGFEVDTNIITIIHRSGKTEQFEKMSKSECASAILDRVAALHSR